MAGEFTHRDISGDPHGRLTQADYESASHHVADGQLANDLLYYNGTAWVRATPATIVDILDIARTATKVVAANDADATVKLQADYSCDGTDDDVQIQAAIDALPAGGGSVQLMGQTFNVGDSGSAFDGYNYSIQLPSNCTLFSMENSTVKLQDNEDSAGAGAVRMIANSTTAGNTNIHIKGLIFDGNKANQVNNESHAIFFNNVSRSSVTDCDFISPQGHGIWCPACHDFWIERNYFSDFINAIYVSGKTDYSLPPYKVHVIGNHVDEWSEAGVGIWFDYGAYDCTCDHNEIDSGTTGDNCIDITRRCKRIVVNNNVCYGDDIVLDNASQTGANKEFFATVSGNTIYGGSITVNTGSFITISGNQLVDVGTGAATSINLTTAEEITASGNVVTRCQRGFQLNASCERVSIVANIVREAEYEAIVVGASNYNIVIKGNILSDYGARASSEEGVDISASASNVDIEGNFFEEDAETTTNYGVFVREGAVNIRILNNQFDSIATPVTLDGAATATIKNNIGYVTENSGTATVASGDTTVTVTHGLAATPTRVQVTPTLLSNAASFWVTAKGATTFVINVNADPGAGTATFDWRARVGEG